MPAETASARQPVPGPSETYATTDRAAPAAASRPSGDGPLKGLRILDLTRLYPGPLATMMLAEMGAEVIKIEDTLRPDPMRVYPPYVGDQSAGFLAVNRGKRSLALKLNSDSGHEVFFDLVKSADVVIEQFRPGVLSQLGIDYYEAIKSNPAIIYVSLTGYGQEGPYAGNAGHDINYIGYSGLLGATGNALGGPALPGGQVADIGGGAYPAVIAVLAAVHARRQTGIGQRVDVSMLDGTLPLMSLQLAHFWATGENPQPWERPLAGGLPAYGVYQCADGRYLALGALEPKFWRLFCQLIGKPDWEELGLQRGDDGRRLITQLQKLFRKRSRSQWLELFGDSDICCTPVLDIPDLEGDPHLRARGMVVEQEHPAVGAVKGIGQPIKFKGTPERIGPAAPLLGEHSEVILSEIGYDDARIDELKKLRIILSR